jgi:hypothetical protein
MSDFSRYIGLPWERGAVGPDAYDCMSFVRTIQVEHFSVDMPAITVPDYGDCVALVELMRGHEERNNWEKVSVPHHGDLVLVHRPMHYGTWLDVDGGGVLHCVKGIGVIFTSDSSWRLSGFGRREYLRHRSKV